MYLSMGLLYKCEIKEGCLLIRRRLLLLQKELEIKYKFSYLSKQFLKIHKMLVVSQYFYIANF